MSPKHVVKFRKRKSQGEGGRDQKCEEPHESPKRVKQELYEKEPAHQESGNRQAMNPMAKGPLHPNKQDKVRNPEEEDVIEVKYVGAGKSRKRTYSNIQDRVEKQHNEKCRSPDVTPDMEQEIMNALGPGPQEDILSSAFKLNITRGDMQTLRESQWLNDDIINFYMNLLSHRSKSPGYASLHTFNTFFYTKLKCGGYRSVKKWTRAVNIFEKDIVLVPVHLHVHWSLVVIDQRKKTVVYWDSMGLKRTDVLGLIFQYLQEESKAKRNIDLDPSEWKQYCMSAEEIPLQLNMNDCGVFTCKYADYISRGQPINFSQQHVPLFRKKMVWEILHKRLL
ncbi:sentrin-specific protease 2-like isoform X1 [Cricetulus griseus]|nr:sentrin-specific protease 2-like isoform X1 [Cricetulus griseus]